MSDTTTKRAQALEACDKVINGIEDGTISVLSSLLLCKKIARLVNDIEGQEWLGYEYGGYPDDGNNHILHRAWLIAAKHGRTYKEKDSEGKTHDYMFSDICGELETALEADSKALGNFNMQGFSASGENAALATIKMSSAAAKNTGILLDRISTKKRWLSILSAQYYDYAVKWQIELQFGNTARSVFEAYQEKVDEYYSLLPTNTLQKLSAIENLLEDGNPERYAQVLTSCRRLWSETANVLFNEVLADYTETHFKTKSGDEIDVSGDHSINKLSAVIETLQSKAAKNTLVGSETIYLIDWMKRINELQSIGVHHDVTREQAMRCIIHTYIALGDILSLKEEVMSEGSEKQKE